MGKINVCDKIVMIKREKIMEIEEIYT